MPRHTFPYDPTRPIDLISLGRVAVDYYAEQIGSPLEDVQSFRMYLGGCPANIAVGSSRLGLEVVMLSRVGDDHLGKFLRNSLEREGVDTSLLKDDPDHLTALAILGLKPPDTFPLLFFRQNCADMQMKPGDIDGKFLKESKALLVTGTCMSSPEMQVTTLHVLDVAKRNSTAVVFDIDYRPSLWKSAFPDAENLESIVTASMHKILPFCDLVVGTEEEIQVAGGAEDIQSALRTIRSFADCPIVQKRGEKGCLIFESDLKQPLESEAFPVPILNVLGAGDAFMSGFLRGWLRGESWETCGKYGNANGALVVSRHGCAPANASFRELSWFIENYRGEPELLESKTLELLHREPVLGHPGAEELFILAFDHRIQLEQTCKEANLEESVIAEFKEKIFEGFLQATETVPAKNAAILIDPTFGGNVLERLGHEPFEVGMPIEVSGSHPVEWIEPLPLYEQILKRTSTHFVKCLWRFHTDMIDDTKSVQIERLRELDNVCRALDRRLMLELIIPDDFELNGKALADAMDAVYESGIYPFWWKIKAVETLEEWQRVCSVIDRFDPDTRIVILGSGAEPERFCRWFAIARSSHHSTGFAIGRTIFWGPWERFAKGEITLEQVPPLICERYLEMVGIWKNA